MRLSQIPDDVKRILLGGDYDEDDLAELRSDELHFLFHYAWSLPVTMALAEREGFKGDFREATRRNPWADEPIVVDEPLPADAHPGRPCSFWFPDDDARPTGPGRGWNEGVLAQRSGGASRVPVEELLRARYADVFQLELYLGRHAPDFASWARKEPEYRQPGPSESRKRDPRGRFAACDPS